MLTECLRSLGSRGFKKICAEGDSKLVIDAVVGSCTSPWRLRMSLMISRMLQTSLIVFHADNVTNTGFHHNNLHIWGESLPSAAHRAFLFDCMKTGCNRDDSI
ncbi:unnamed protein product [Malus baccata var. baccata]